MSVHITGGTLGFSLGPLLFAPAAQHFGLEWTPLLAIPGLVVIAFFLTRVPPITVHHDGIAGFRALRPYARPLGAPLHHRRPADADVAGLRDVRPRDADAARD